MSALRRETALLLALGALALLLGLSAFRAYEPLTWLLEIFPILLAVPLLLLTYRRFPLTGLLYGLIFVHAVILMVGGHYTYARVPLGFAMERWLGLHRNPYDKLGHFAQGFVPAIAAREVLLRGGHLRTRGMRIFVVLCIVLAISAAYELVEWASAVALGQGAEAFLGTQGDPWDTQSDMLFAFIGGTAALLLLSKVHDRRIAALDSGD